MRFRTASLATIAALAVGSTALSACGNSSKQAAYVPLTQANFTSSMVAAVKGKNSFHEVTTSGGKTASVEFDAHGGTLVERITQQVPASKGSPAGTIVAILIGNDLYARKTPGKTGGKWVKVQASNANLASVTGGAAKSDPGAVVSNLTKGMTSFKYVGATEIDGTPVEQYQLTLTAAAMGQGVGSADLGANAPVTEAVYLNKDNTLRRLIVMTPLGNVTVDFTDWGKPLGITAPPASDIMPAKK